MLSHMLVLLPCMVLLTWVKWKDIGQRSMEILHSLPKSQIESQRTKNHGFFFLYRILWLITISAGFAFSVIVINPLYDRFFNNPIIRSIESNNYPIENISFPAVTICSNNKVRTLSEKSKFCIMHYDFM